MKFSKKKEEEEENEEIYNGNDCVYLQCRAVSRRHVYVNITISKGTSDMKCNRTSLINSIGVYVSTDSIYIAICSFLKLQLLWFFHRCFSARATNLWIKYAMQHRKLVSLSSLAYDTQWKFKKKNSQPMYIHQNIGDKVPLFIASQHRQTRQQQ